MAALDTSLQDQYTMFRRRIEGGIKTVRTYEDPVQQHEALSQMDFPAILEHYSAIKDSSIIEESKKGEDELVLRALLRWFKRDFFKWCNQPPCANAHTHPTEAQDMRPAGTDTSKGEEAEVGWASRVEVYQCQHCASLTRFPRYNNPAHLLRRSRRGRCGEFANAFGLVCRSVGFDVRYVLDFTDHVWVEAFVPSLLRFVHLDPCEEAFDAPLLYEAGWRKGLTHVLAFGRYGVWDVVDRYTRERAAVLRRRGEGAGALPEPLAAHLVEESDALVLSTYRGGAEGEEALGWEERLHLGAGGLGQVLGEVNRLDLPLSEVLRRREVDAQDLILLRYAAQRAVKEGETGGRESGDVNWRRERGEVHEGGRCAAEGREAQEEEREGEEQGVAIASSLFLDGEIVTSFHLLVQLGERVRNDFLLPLSPSPSRRCVVLNHTPLSLPVGRIHALVLSTRGALFRFSFPSLSPILAVLSPSERGEREEREEREEKGEGFEEVYRRERGLLLVYDTREEGEGGEGLFPLSPLFSLPPTLSLFSFAGGRMEGRGEGGGGEGIERESLSYLSLEMEVREKGEEGGEGAWEFARREGRGWERVGGVELLQGGQWEGKGEEEVAREVQRRCGGEFVGFSLLPLSAEGQGGYLAFYSPPSPCSLPLGGLHSYQKKSPLPPLPAFSLGPLSVSLREKYYYYLGGGHHADTHYFDTSFSPALSNSPATSLTLYGGRSLVNGVRFSPAPYQGTIFTSPQDAPAPSPFTIPPGHYFNKVVAHCGALVDRLELHTAQEGQVVAAGGQGGERREFSLPPLLSLRGFWGGMGGHLHNLGLVLSPRREESERERETPLFLRGTALPPLLLSLLLSIGEKEGGLWNDPAHFNNNSAGGRDMYRNSDLQGLQARIAAIVMENSAEEAAVCLRCIVQYFRNILQNPSDAKFLRISLSNKVLHSKVLSRRGGLSLLCFGPAGFALSRDRLQLQSRFSSALAQAPPAFPPAVLRAWLEGYAQLLQGVAELLQQTK